MVDSAASTGRCFELSTQPRARPELVQGRAMIMSYRIVPAGDAALIVEFEDRIDPAVNARTIACAEAIQRASLAGVRDVVPTYRSVAGYFDPLHTSNDALMACLEGAASRPSAPPAAAVAPLRIPVCYGTDLGPDL